MLRVDLTSQLGKIVENGFAVRAIRTIFQQFHETFDIETLVLSVFAPTTAVRQMGSPWLTARPREWLISLFHIAQFRFPQDSIGFHALDADLPAPIGIGFTDPNHSAKGFTAAAFHRDDISLLLHTPQSTDTSPALGNIVGARHLQASPVGTVPVGDSNGKGHVDALGQALCRRLGKLFCQNVPAERITPWFEISKPQNEGQFTPVTVQGLLAVA